LIPPFAFIARAAAFAPANIPGKLLDGELTVVSVAMTIGLPVNAWGFPLELALADGAIPNAIRLITAVYEPSLRTARRDRFAAPTCPTCFPASR
jgi:hypothetical protein